MSYFQDIAQYLTSKLNAVIQKLNEKASKLYVQSRGINLITNGSGLMGDNTNFTSFNFDGSQVFAGKGSFKLSSGGATRFNDEPIPVDPNKTYRLSLYAKWQGTTQPRHNFGIHCYDVDLKGINAYHVRWLSGSESTLTQPLNVGDTKIYVDNISGWDDSSNINHQRAVIMWGYKNSYGFTYPAYTYSRFRINDAYAQNAGFGSDANGDYIQLKQPWPYANPNSPSGEWPVGSDIAQSWSGAVYKYIASSGELTPQNWTKYNGYIGTIDYSSDDNTYTFRPGTAFIKLLFLLNRDATNSETTWLNNLEFAEADVQRTVQGDVEILGDATIQGQIDTANDGNSAEWSNAYSHVSQTGNPHGVTKSQVGLGNVDNTSDVNKPVSSAQQTALNNKSDVGHGHSISDVANLQISLNNKADIAHQHSVNELTGKRDARIYIDRPNGGQDCVNGAYIHFPDVGYLNNVSLYRDEGFQINNEGVYLISFNITLQTQLNDRSVYQAKLYNGQNEVEGAGGRTYMRNVSYGSSGTVTYTGIHHIETGIMRVFVNRFSGAAAPTLTIGGLCSFSITRVG